MSGRERGRSTRRQEGSRAGYGVKGNMFVLGIKECGFESCYPEEKDGEEKGER